ncbi:MAG: hypothetical protein ACRERU_18110 [Methylococcales bacterium]
MLEQDPPCGLTGTKKRSSSISGEFFSKTGAYTMPESGDCFGDPKLTDLEAEKWPV